MNDPSKNLVDAIRLFITYLSLISFFVWLPNWDLFPPERTVQPDVDTLTSRDMTIAPLVCIIDDSLDYGLILKKLFSHSFSAYSFCFCASGQVFLEQLPKLSTLPKLIVLDRHMPILDGYQTLMILKGHSAYKKIPVVMMSAHASAHEINRCYESGANSFLRKPMDFDILKKQFEQMCQYWLELNIEPMAEV